MKQFACLPHRVSAADVRLPAGVHGCYTAARKERMGRKRDSYIDRQMSSECEGWGVGFL